MASRGGLGGAAPEFDDGAAGGPLAKRANAPKAQPPGGAEALAALVILFWLGGGPVYLRNALAFGNPVWPYAARVPFGLATLPGPLDPAREWTRPFLLGPGDAARLVRSWFTLPPLIWPDIRGGGYGPLFRWLGLWCVVAVAALAIAAAVRSALRLRAFGPTLRASGFPSSVRPERSPAQRGAVEGRELLAILALFALALAVPDPWWPRYSLGAGAAALAALAAVRCALTSSAARRVLGAAAVALAVAGLVEGWPGYRVLPSLGRAVRMDASERATIQAVNWLWPEAGARLREAELREGDAVAYDSSVTFLGQLWARDLRNRAVYVEHPSTAGDRRSPYAQGDRVGNDAEYLRRLHEAGAVWAMARPGSPAEGALARAGAERLFTTERDPADVWRLPWSPTRRR